MFTEISQTGLLEIIDLIIRSDENLFSLRSAVENAMLLFLYERWLCARWIDRYSLEFNSHHRYARLCKIKHVKLPLVQEKSEGVAWPVKVKNI